MLLTVSKRLEFSASRRLFVKEWGEAENLAAFGPETNAHYVTGRNYVAYFVFSGEVDPVGVGVICEARHFCMMMRGVEKQHSGALTSAMLGAFRNRKETRDEFLALVNHKTD